jgi:apolipoprotein D and lipocalin family protein
MKLLVMSLMFLMSCAFASNNAPLNTEAYVDINKYAGRWYEIAKIPNRFQRKCGATRATYSLKDNGKVKVFNECIKLKNGKIQDATGEARVFNPGRNSILKVSFAPFPFRRLAEGDYYIMKLDVNYDHVLVGSPTRDYLWILSRSKVLDEEIIQDLLAVAAQNGFDITRVKRTPVWK